MKPENDEFEVKIVNPSRRPESGGDETKQQKPKPPSPLITEIERPEPVIQVHQKTPSESIPTTKPKPSPNKQQ